MLGGELAFSQRSQSPEQVKADAEHHVNFAWNVNSKDIVNIVYNIKIASMHNVTHSIT